MNEGVMFIPSIMFGLVLVACGIMAVLAVGMAVWELIIKPNDGKEAKRYRWLRDTGRLDGYWASAGPITRPDNIDATIDTLMRDD